MATFTPYDTATHHPTDLFSALAPSGSGVQLVPGTLVAKMGTTQGRAGGEVSSLSFYDGSVAALGLGAGLLLTSGDSAPPQTNTSSSYGEPLSPSNGDTQLEATVKAAFSYAGTVKDVTSLEFQFTVSQGQSIQLDLVFASDEYPEFSNTSYVDIAGVYVNGQNYAYFNGQASQPLSVLNSNLAAGNFTANQNGLYPLEYDGVSHKLTVIAPVQSGTNTLKIAIGDTGDQIYDSGVFVANLRVTDYAGAGLALQTTGSSGKDVLQGQDFNEYFDLGGGDDVLILGKGDDVVVGGAGLDAIAFYGVFDPAALTPTSSGYLYESSALGNKTLVGVELLYSSESGLFGLDTNPGENTWFVYALIHAITEATPPTALLSQWVKAMSGAASFGALAQQVIDTYAPGIDPAVLVQLLYQNIVGVPPTSDQVATLVNMIGPGKTFASAGEFLAAAATLDLNTQEIAAIVGKPVALDVNYFV